MPSNIFKEPEDDISVRSQGNMVWDTNVVAFGLVPIHGSLSADSAVVRAGREIPVGLSAAPPGQL